MNTREIASAYRLSQWSQALQEKKADGESINAFCRRKGVSRNTYFYWQRKLRETAFQNLMPPASSLELAEKAIVPNCWAVVSERTLEPSSELSTITIEIGKFRVSAEKDTMPEQLEKTLRVLMKLC